MEPSKQDLNRLKNAIHNEVGITKQEIREMVEEAIKSLVDKRVKQLLPDKISMDKLVDRAIEERSMYFWNAKNEKKFDESIETKVAKILAGKIKIEVKKK